MPLTPTERRSRLAFDYQICQQMNGDVVRIAAYRTSTDLERQRNPITALAQAEQATKYRVEFHVPTLTGPGKFAEVTVIGFDLATGDYPFSEPATWLISEHVPYSPHFMRGAPVCIGSIWRSAQGQMLLGQLVIHIAKLLNWDEIARGGGYVGWNGAAIAYHRQHYGTKPLNPDLVLPALPVALTHGLADTALFSLVAMMGTADDLFGVVASARDNDLFGTA